MSHDLDPSKDVAAAGQSIHQAVNTVDGQVIDKMMGGIAVGQLTVYLSQVLTEKTGSTATPLVELGKNPYQGLKAFREEDGDRFFGREVEIQELCQRFQQLYDDRSTIRMLPIYGPSGSGKSSLARAGLIPALGKQPLPGHDRGRVAVLTPGDHPLEALAAVLARIATNDPIPVKKTREFKEELLEKNQQQKFDGLRRITDVFPEIEVSPLIILVDQFEEIYTLCDDVQERLVFIENLLCAASDRAQRVAVILTMRSDFLGATQQHPHLNQLFSSQGFLVPIMQPEELAIAIAEPAKRAGYVLDKATVRLLVEESEGQEGALPLLQFALTQIWEGLRKGIQPAETLEEIGGVGGALASEAKRLYESLAPEQQKIARCIFLSLIQLNDDNKATRRRASIAELINHKNDEPLVRSVIDRFSRPGVWILITFANEQQLEMVEVAHEALIRNWQDLQEWLKEHWQLLHQKQKIEQAAAEWRDHQKSKDYLLQGRLLRDAREFINILSRDTILSNLATELIQASMQQQRKSILRNISLFSIFPGAILLIGIHIGLIRATEWVLMQKRCELITNENQVKRISYIKYFVQYLWWPQYKLETMNLCGENLQNIKLKNAHLSSIQLQYADLFNAQLQHAQLQHAQLQHAYLFYADLTGADLTGANLTGANLTGADLTGADLTGATIDPRQLKGATLCRTILPQYTYLLKGDSERCISNSIEKKVIP